MYIIIEGIEGLGECYGYLIAFFHKNLHALAIIKTLLLEIIEFLEVVEYIRPKLRISGPLASKKRFSQIFFFFDR